MTTTETWRDQLKREINSLLVLCFDRFTEVELAELRDKLVSQLSARMPRIKIDEVLKGDAVMLAMVRDIAEAETEKQTSTELIFAKRKRRKAKVKSNEPETL